MKNVSSVPGLWGPFLTCLRSAEIDVDYELRWRRPTRSQYAAFSTARDALHCALLGIGLESDRIWKPATPALTT